MADPAQAQEGRKRTLVLNDRTLCSVGVTLTRNNHLGAAQCQNCP